MTTGGAFFNDPKTINALATLARAEQLTIVAGAGVSVEAGLPTWGGLVHTLLVAAGRRLLGGRATQRPEPAEAFARWTIASDGLLAGAAVARANGQGESQIRKALYATTPNPRPGPSARALADLALRTPGVELSTQNYDDCLGLALEERLEEMGETSTVHRVVSGAPIPPAGRGVRHLHGLLTPTKKDGVIVLAEGDYFDMGDGAWQAAWMRDRLVTGPCLFVGSSMSDPNLLRYLHQAAGSRVKGDHFAVLPRQADSWLHRETPEDAVRDARDAGALARWEALGLTVLQPDYYSDSAQFLYELLHQRTSSGAGSYADRLRRWQHDIDRDLLRTSSLTEFADQQDWLHEELETYRVQVQDRLAGAALMKDERLQVSLWVRQQGDSLLLLAASDRAHRDPETLEPVAINGPSEWVSVLAYRSGSTLLADTSSNVTSRWNTVMGIPVSIHDPTYGRLQVGVVTLAGTAVVTESVLAPSGAGPEALADIRSSLETQAAALLTPPPL